MSRKRKEQTPLAAPPRLHCHAVLRAASFVCAQVTGGRIRTATPLPSIRQLASEAGVSLVSMWRAVGLLQSRGILTRKGRRFIAKDYPGQDITDSFGIAGHSPAGSTAGPEDPEPPGDTPVASGKRWQRVCRQITRDILVNRYKPGEILPTAKELQSRYGVSFPTLKKALSDLADKGVLLPSGRTFSVPGIVSSRSSVRFVLFVPCSNDGKPNLGVHNEQLYRMIEAQCSAGNIALRVIGYQAKDDSVSYVDQPGGESCRIPLGRDILGYCVMAVAPDRPHEQIISHLSTTSKPIAVLDEVGGWQPTRRRAGKTRVFPIGTTSLPGEIVARYLMALGHRSVAYISPYHRASWSVRRLGGIRDIYRCAGISDAVHTFTIPHPASPEAFQKIARERCDFDDLFSSLDDWTNRNPPAFTRLIKGLFALRGRDILVAEGGISVLLEPLFEKALSNPSITAWIAANDSVALHALSFLETRRKPVPAKISVIGFDDMLEALRHNLTSYNFNMAAMANAGIRFIVGQDTPRALSMHDQELTGFVVERATTARANRKK